MVRGTLLDGHGDDVAGFLFAFFLRLGFDFTHLGGGVMEGFLLDAVDHQLLGRFAVQAGDPFQFSQLLGLELFQLVFLLGQVSHFVVQGFFAGFQVAGLLVQGFLTLDQAAFILLDFVAAFPDFPFILRTFPVVFCLRLQDFLLGFQHFFLLVIFCFADGVVIQTFGIIFRPFDFLFGEILPVGIS